MYGNFIYISYYLRILLMHPNKFCFTIYIDKIPQDEEYNYISLQLFIAYAIIAIIGIIFAIICVIINLWLRDRKYVIIF